MAPDVNAQFHQHMFSMRIDPAVDDGEGGAGLVVAEVRRRGNNCLHFTLLLCTLLQLLPCVVC